MQTETHAGMCHMRTDLVIRSVAIMVCDVVGLLLAVGMVSLQAVAAIEGDRPSFGPLPQSARPVGREYIWPEGRMPHFQSHQVAEKTEVVKSKCFNREANRMPFLEWYEPAASNKTKTCILVLSGGGYETCCDAARLQPAIDRFVQSGLTVANLTYRTPRPKNLPIYQSSWADAQRAVRLIRAQAAKRGFSPERIGATGISAGAKTVLLLALSARTPAYERVDALDDCSCRLAFAIPQAPAYVLTDGATGKNARGGEGADIVPELRFDADTAPLCCLQGGIDVYSPLGSVRLCQRLRKLGVAAELHLFADRWHGFHGDANRGADGTAWDHWCDRMLDFVALFEPDLVQKRSKCCSVSLDAVRRVIADAGLPPVLVCGKDEAELSDALLDEWVVRRRRGVQSDLHVFARPIDDYDRAVCCREFANHRQLSYPYVECGK